MEFKCEICNKTCENKSKLETHKLSIEHCCKANAKLIAYVYKYSKLIDNILESYVGSTSNLKKRHSRHKSCLDDPENNCKFYQFLRERELKIDDFDKKILHTWEIDCKGKKPYMVEKEMSEKEQEFIDKLQPTLNTYNASGEDVERKKERVKQWYLENKDEITKKIPCEICGILICKSSMVKHQKRRICVKPTIINNITNNITNIIKKQVNITKKN